MVAFVPIGVLKKHQARFHPDRLRAWTESRFLNPGFPGLVDRSRRCAGGDGHVQDPLFVQCREEREAFLVLMRLERRRYPAPINRFRLRQGFGGQVAIDRPVQETGGVRFSYNSEVCLTVTKAASRSRGLFGFFGSMRLRMRMIREQPI
jgi:hypothetical protein